MNEVNRDGWAPVLLGFFGLFIVMGILVIGMLPAWVVLVAAMMLIGISVALFAVARRLLLHH